MTLHVGGFNGYAVAVVAMNMKHRCWCGFHGICRLGGAWNGGLRTIVLGTGNGHGLLVSDPIFPLLNRSRQMSEMIDDAEMVILDGCAHMPALEAPARCAHWIADFLARRGLL